MGKSPFQSKTILVNLFFTLCGLASQLQPVASQLASTGLSDVWVSRIGLGLTVLGILGVYLRSVTDSPVTLKGTE